MPPSVQTYKRNQNYSFSRYNNLYILRMKPQFLIHQACRGIETTGGGGSSDISSDSAVHCVRGWPAISDYMVASATIEDFVSFRSTVEGSFFIRHLCKVLQDHGHQKTLADVMIIVNNKVQYYKQFG